jgi:hypothetical protein
MNGNTQGTTADWAASDAKNALRLTEGVWAEINELTKRIEVLEKNFEKLCKKQKSEEE